MAKLKARIEADPEKLLEYLAEIEYPHPWTLESLQGKSIIVRVEDEEEYTRAYVWALWSLRHRNALDFHAASTSRLWLSPALLGKLYVIAEFIGANKLVTWPAGSNEPVIRSLLQRRGFREEGDYLVKDL